MGWAGRVLRVRVSGTGIRARALHGAVVGGEGVVEGHFIIGVVKALPPIPGGIELLGQGDQLFEHLRGGEGTDGVNVERSLELLRKSLTLNEVALGTNVDPVVEKFLRSSQAIL
jgi:hypothetical protein